MSEGQTIRTTEGKIKFLESNNPFLYPVEIWALNEKVNRNNWQYTRIADRLELFRNIPILIAYNMGGAVIGGGHQFDQKLDPETGEAYASFTAADAERIVGWVHEKAHIRIEKDEEGTEWAVMDSYLWKWYAREAVEAIASEQGRGMSVSIETLVTKEHMVGDVAVEDDYVVLGITILGHGVQPAVAGAHIKTLSNLSEMRDAMHENVLKAASYIEDRSKPNVQEKNSLNERMRTLTYFSKKQCAELSKRFDGYTVLAAAQDENNVIHVALLSKTGDTAVYNMNSVDETIAVEKIKSCSGTVSFDCDGNCVNADLDSVMSDMCAVVDEANANCKNAQAAEQKANEALNTAMATIADMRNAENARRVASAKACARKVLDAFNATADFEIPGTALDSINADIDNGVYTERVNADGTWVGEEDVIMRVKALCADETIKVNNDKAAKNNSVFVWEKLNNGLNDDGSVAALLKRKGIE